MGAPNPLDEKSRGELVEEARRMGVERPERMTRVELRDEIVRRSVPEERQAEARGLFGVARSMIASVVDKGLNLPDAAKAIRGGSSFEVPVTSQTPVATVTLAEIYAAQGHKSRALRILDDVLAEEPGHEEALRVKRELSSGTGTTELPEETDDRKSPREALTAEAPPVEPVPQAGSEAPPEIPGETTEYMPGGFVETTGEEIQTGRQPAVEEVETVVEVEAEEQVEPAEEPPSISDKRFVALVLSQSSSGLSLYWELPDATLDECSVDRTDGRAVARVVSFAPHGASPERLEDTVELAETIRVSAPTGCRAGMIRLGRHAAPSFVRAALGWESEDGFLPFTVGRSRDEWKDVADSENLIERASAELG